MESCIDYLGWLDIIFIMIGKYSYVLMLGYGYNSIFYKVFLIFLYIWIFKILFWDEFYMVDIGMI